MLWSKSIWSISFFRRVHSHESWTFPISSQKTLFCPATQEKLVAAAPLRAFLNRAGECECGVKERDHSRASDKTETGTAATGGGDRRWQRQQQQ